MADWRKERSEYLTVTRKGRKAEREIMEQHRDKLKQGYVCVHGPELIPKDRLISVIPEEIWIAKYEWKDDEDVKSV